MNSCMAIYSRATLCVYGPTAREYLACRRIGFHDTQLGTLIDVKEIPTPWLRDQDRRVRPYWEREARPQQFFTKNLGRSFVPSGLGANDRLGVNRSAGEIYDEQMGEVPEAPAGRSPDVDEAGGIV